MVRRLELKSLRLALLVAYCAAAACSAAERAAQAGYVLQGDNLSVRFQVVQNGLRVAEAKDRRSGATLHPEEAFSLVLRDGSTLAASQFRLNSSPRLESIAVLPTASRAAEQRAGQKLCAEMVAPDGGLTVHWCALMRKGTDYLRQEIRLQAGAAPADIAKVKMFDFAAPHARVVGTVPGSPLVDGGFFFGFESPLSTSEVKSERATAELARVLPLGAHQSITYSSVLGVTAPGQLRRDFLAYLELERAHPYRTFLHYNTWYDIGFGERFTEAQALDRVHAFSEEMVRKRGVRMDSFLFDDGWDDTHALWSFNPGFPEGFTQVHQAALQGGFGIGAWLSPWGGYDAEKAQRIAAGKLAGYEIVDGGFALSGPKYYKLFEQTCLDLMAKYGVNQFKFDGTGNANQVFPGSVFDSDFSAAIHLIERLRQQDPNLFVNLTTGTRPSPFWLLYADSIWRGGRDNDFAGVGSDRQKWITYRDAQTYRNTVEAGPLFPLSSLMLHGLILAREAARLNADPGHDFTAEVHSYFGSGTQLQEMYLTPSLLSEQDWNTLAEAAKWSRANASVLQDTHWIGGDPAKLEVYGWASWTPRKGIVTLRNPSDHEQEFALDVSRAFELPAGAAQRYAAHSPWAAGQEAAAYDLRAGHVQRILLKPFEVLTLDAEPRP